MDVNMQSLLETLPDLQVNPLYLKLASRQTSVSHIVKSDAALMKNRYWLKLQSVVNNSKQCDMLYLSAFNFFLTMIAIYLIHLLFAL